MLDVGPERGRDLTTAFERRNVGSLSVADGVAKVGYPIQGVELRGRGRSYGPKLVDHVEPEPTEIGAQSARSRSPGVEFPPLLEQRADHRPLLDRGNGDVYADSFVMEITAKCLKL